jgi:hypothetical protein
MNTWPVSLQQALNDSGFSYIPGETAISTEMDVGARKVRNRYTFGIDKIEGNIDLHKSLYTTLITFYKTTSAGGTLPFEFKHPVTLATIIVRFLSAPKITRLGGEYFSASISLEVVG